MLIDIQGPDFTLYDPEIATDNLLDLETSELYFCVATATKIRKYNDFCNGFTCFVIAIANWVLSIIVIFIT